MKVLKWLNGVSRFANRDSVAITGSIIGLGSFGVGWLTLKPSRLAAGISLNLWDSLGWGAVIVICLWLACFAFSLTQKKKLSTIALGTTANLTVIITFILTGLSAGHLLEGAPAFARVSLSTGFWLTIIGACILVFTSRQRLDNLRLWRELISWTGLVAIAILFATGWMNDLSVMQEFTTMETRFAQELLNHIILFGGSVVIATLIGIPLGLWAVRSKWAERPAFFVVNIVQTIPSLALFGFLIAPLSALSFAFPVLREFGIRGIGTAPAIIALVIYSLLPIVRNTFVGLKQVDLAFTDAGMGMGMSRRQIFFRVEAPLAAPLIMQGVRIAAVQSVGLAAVAALIGAGGLGSFIFQGLGEAAADLILLGALPIIALALIVDILMRGVVRISTPRGLLVRSQ